MNIVNRDTGLLSVLDLAGQALRRGQNVVVTGAADLGAFVMKDARKITATDIAFWACNLRGLIGVATNRAQVDRFGLSLQSRTNRVGHGFVYAQSIEARSGVSTGISAADRALTIRIFADANAAPGDLVTPGHVFPYCAAPGGLAQFSGAAEAATQIMCHAGLPPVAATCSLLNDAAEPATAAQSHAFACTHGLCLLDISLL